MSKDTFIECRYAFEDWYRITYRDAPLVNQTSEEVHEIEYSSVAVRLRWDGWKAAWEHQAKDAEKANDAMMAMSDSLGAMAND